MNRQMGKYGGFESIEFEAKLKVEKHKAGPDDEWLVITWLATCDCAPFSDGGVPEHFGAIVLMRSQLQ